MTADFAKYSDVRTDNQQVMICVFGINEQCMLPEPSYTDEINILNKAMNIHMKPAPMY